MSVLHPIIQRSLANEFDKVKTKRAKAARAAKTYIVDDASDEFYKAARGYYESWGYGRQSRVKSMEDIIGSLAGSSGVEHVRIVTHGGFASSEQSMELAVFGAGKDRPNAGTKWTGSQELLLADPGPFVAAMLDDLMSDDALGPLKSATRLVAPAGSAASEQPFFANLSEATLEAAKAAGLLQDTTGIYETQHYQWSSERTAIAATAALALVDSYRRSPDGSLADNEVEWIEAMFKELKDIGLSRATTTKKAELERFLGLYTGDAQRLAETVANPGTVLRALHRRLKKPIAAVREEGRAEGAFFQKLAKARAALRPGAEIEIRGCNIGRDQTMMNRLRDLFTAPGASNRAVDGQSAGASGPVVSAPTLFQVFTKIAVTGFTTTTPGEPPPQSRSKIARLTRDAEGLLNNDFLVNMSQTERPFDEVVKDFHRGSMARLDEKAAQKRRNMLYRVKDIEKFNPGIDLQKIPAFGKVWLRPVALEEREAHKRGEPLSGVDAYLNRAPGQHELLVRATGGAPKRDATLKASVKDWVRRFLGEELSGEVKNGLYITYLTAHSNMPSAIAQRANLPIGGGDLSATDPILFPGQAQFWRHINYTR